MPRHEKTIFFHMRKQRCRSALAVTVKLISAFVFATQLEQSLYYLNPKFKASSHLLWLYSLVCVGPGWKPRRPVFSQRGSYSFCSCRAGTLESDLSKTWKTVLLKSGSYKYSLSRNHTKISVKEDLLLHSLYFSGENGQWH